MRYIVMCGGSAFKLSTPKPMAEVGGEMLVQRTIRLLRENGVSDIAISSTDIRFQSMGVPLLMHDNPKFNSPEYHWLNAFFPAYEPICYIFGDVFFSPQAIETIVNTDTDDIEFFASSPPFSKYYKKDWAEPFAFKVVNYKRFFDCIKLAKHYEESGKFHRDAISWELWQVIKDTPLNVIDYHNYTAINDYTVDIDDEWDIKMLDDLIKEIDNG